jgi:hypothetical protein
MKKVFQLSVILIFISCMNQSPRYHYADGSANVYDVTESSLEYIPVRPEQSSTGMYSGGNPGKISLTTEQFNSIKDLMEVAIRKTDIHIPDRIKTSGLVSRIGGVGDTTVFITGASTEMREIEALLHKLLPTGK